MSDATRQLTLFVRSKKAVTTFYRPIQGATTGSAAVPPGGAMGTSATPTRGADDAELIADSPVYFLSDDQARCAALVEEFARRRGYDLKVVDIERAGRLERMVAEHLKGVQTFPVLLAPNGRRLEGIDAFTEEAIAELMPTELKGVVRAFTYLKVRGGQFDQIRAQLESLAPVKEMHFLTGDWDVFLVLEFRESAAGKRQVLDFVTEKIRGIPEVIDTSTLVPEWSVTKFPLLTSEREASRAAASGGGPGTPRSAP